MQTEMKNINLLQLEALVHLVEERSFSRAAKRMFLTQPSLTKHIRNLEDALGAKVVNRASRDFTLTPEGRVIFDYARRILKLREEAADRVMRVRASEAGDIRVAASTIPATYILPPAIAEFRRRHPAIRTAVRAADSSEVIETVLENGAEIGFIGKKPASAKLADEPLWRDRMVLAVPAAHPWAKRRSVRLREIREEPFVIREKGSATREAFECCLAGEDGADPAGLRAVSMNKPMTRVSGRSRAQSMYWSMVTQSSWPVDTARLKSMRSSQSMMPDMPEPEWLISVTLPPRGWLSRVSKPQTQTPSAKL